MIKKIKEALKKAGINEKYAAKVQAIFNVESEDNLETYINLFKDNILPDIEANDTAAAAANAKAIADYEKKHGLKDGKVVEKKGKGKKGKKEEKEDDEEEDDDDTKGLPASVVKMMKAHQKQIAELTGQVTSLATNLTDTSKKTAARTVFNDAKLPEKWFGRLDVNSEISIEDQIKDLQEEYAEIRQSAVNEEVGNGNYNPHSYTPKERTEKEYLEVFNKEASASSDFGTASLGLD